MLTKITDKIRPWLSSRQFFWLTIGFFVFEALWIALSAAFPQAFDEDFHFGIIQVYAHYWLPFLKTQPPHADAYGALAHDPSYLYYYLLSFPYRIMTQLGVHGQMSQVIILRLINIAFFTSGLLLFRRVLQRAGLSALALNMCMFVTALIPVTSLVAGQINYDNLLLPITAWTCLIAMDLIDELRAHRPQLQTVLLLLAACCIGTVTKYEFAPIFFAIGLFFVIAAIRALRGHVHEAVQQMRSGWLEQSRLRRLLVLALCIAAVGLFTQRTGYNLVHYHSIAPDCSRTLSIERCNSYYVWNHDYTTHQQVLQDPGLVNMNFAVYTLQWAYWLWFRLLFAVSGAPNEYANYPPLPLPAAALAVLLIGAVIAFAMRARHVISTSRYTAFFCTIVAVYLTTLFSQGYQKYHQTAVLQLMNGRYLLPVLLPAAAIGALAAADLLRRKPRAKVIIAALAIICFLQGGGIFTFISRSDDSWYWPDSRVIAANHTARRIISPLIFESDKTYPSVIWYFN